MNDVDQVSVPRRMVDQHIELVEAVVRWHVASEAFEIPCSSQAAAACIAATKRLHELGAALIENGVRAAYGPRP